MKAWWAQIDHWRARHCLAYRSSPDVIMPQLAIERLYAATKHRVVVRLKGGDPMLFGRAQEEIAALRDAGIQCEIVPGVTAALGAAANAGVSLTQRNMARSVAFVTPRVGEGAAPSTWAKAAIAADTAVIYMGAGQAAEIATTLIAGGVLRDTPTLIIENATLPAERRFAMPLSQLLRAAELGITGPAVIMIGEVFRAVQTSAEDLNVHLRRAIARGISARVGETAQRRYNSSF